MDEKVLTAAIGLAGAIIEKIIRDNSDEID